MPLMNRGLFSSDVIAQSIKNSFRDLKNRKESRPNERIK